AYAMIVFVLPDSYLPATVAIPALAVSAVVFGVTRVQQGLFIAADAPGTVSTIEVFGTAAALIAYVLLIPQFGMLGAAYGSIIGYSLCAVVGAIALRRVRRKRRPSEVDGSEDGDDCTGARTSGLCANEPGDVVEPAGRSADSTKEGEDGRADDRAIRGRSGKLEQPIQHRGELARSPRRRCGIGDLVVLPYGQAAETCAHCPEPSLSDDLCAGTRISDERLDPPDPQSSCPGTQPHRLPAQTASARRHLLRRTVARRRGRGSDLREAAWSQVHHRCAGPMARGLRDGAQAQAGGTLRPRPAAQQGTADLSGRGRSGHGLRNVLEAGGGGPRR